MTRYAAFLRGVSPMNCRMPELTRALEAAGFEDVKTLLSSGNAVFTAAKASNESLQKKCEAAMQKHLGQAFLTFVRPIDDLRKILASDPYKGFRIEPAHKRIVTFMRAPSRGKLDLPIELDGASIIAIKGTEIFSAYLPTAKGPVFMTLLQKTFGKEQTTRTWQTLEKVAR
jgi:uncharacterized protein (DUF1697 family)